MTQKAQSGRTDVDVTKKTKSELKKTNNMRRERLSLLNSTSASPGGISFRSSPSGGYLLKEGDHMNGPLALGASQNFSITISLENTIDIGDSGNRLQYSSNILLNSTQTNSYVLDIIANAAFDGQILIIKTFAPTTPFTIRQGTINNRGNIQTEDSNDITLGNLQTLTLIFDESLVINANTGGTWRVIGNTSGGGGGSGGANQTLSNLVSPTSINQHLIPNSSNTHDLGSAVNRWSNVHTLAVSSSTIIAMTAPNSLTLNSNLIILGDETTDNISFVGRISSNLIPNSSNTHDLGSAVNRWSNVHTLAVSSSTIIAMTAPNSLTLNSNLIILGDETTDNISFVGRISSNLIPNSSNTHDLGSAVNRWSNVHTLAVSSSTIIAMTAPNSLTLNSNLIILGDETTDNISFVGRISSNLIPNSSNTHDLGSSDNNWRNMYTHAVRSNSDISLFANDDIILDTQDDLVIRNDGNVKMTYNGGNDNFVFNEDILLDNGSRIRSNDSTEIGLFVTNATSSVGSAGSNQCPTSPSISPSFSNFEAAFGIEVGCMGQFTQFSLDYWVRKTSSDTWLAIIVDATGIITGVRYNR